MSFLLSPSWVKNFKDYNNSFPEQLITLLLADINIYNIKSNITEKQINFLQLASRSKIPNSKINLLLKNHYQTQYENNLGQGKDNINTEMQVSNSEIISNDKNLIPEEKLETITNSDSISNDEKVITEQEKETSNNPDFNSINKSLISEKNKIAPNSNNFVYNRTITTWQDLTVEDIQILFAHYRNKVTITHSHIKSLQKKFTIDEINLLLKTNYQNFYQITYSQYYILKSNNVKFNLFSSDFPIITNINFELGIQYSKLCPDQKMFYLKFYDLLMIDIDNLNLEQITKICDKYKNQFKFHIYQSYNGYHVFITSEKIPHDSEKMVKITQALHCDIFYLKFAYKNGYKIRLSPKINRNETFISKYICAIGTAVEDPELVELLQKHNYYVKFFENIYQMDNSETINDSKTIKLNWDNKPLQISHNDTINNSQTINNIQTTNAIINDLSIYSEIWILLQNSNFYFYKYFLSLNYNLRQVQQNLIPELKVIFQNLNKNKIRKFLLSLNYEERQKYNSLINNFIYTEDNSIQLSTNSDFIRLLHISLTNFLIKPQRLLIDDEQYYVACDTYTKTYYICYKHLLMCDIDFYKDNSDSKFSNISEIISFLSEYSVQKKLTFRVYSSRNGVHVFVTSQKMNFKSDFAFQIMSDLQTDFYYILYSKIRGWCVRLNKKENETNDSLYQYHGKIGTEIENNELLDLINLHLKLVYQLKDADKSLIYAA